MKYLFLYTLLFFFLFAHGQTVTTKILSDSLRKQRDNVITPQVNTLLELNGSTSKKVQAIANDVTVLKASNWLSPDSNDFTIKGTVLTIKSKPANVDLTPVNRRQDSAAIALIKHENQLTTIEANQIVFNDRDAIQSQNLQDLLIIVVALQQSLTSLKDSVSFLRRKNDTLNTKFNGLNTAVYVRMNKADANITLLDNRLKILEGKSANESLIQKDLVNVPTKNLTKKRETIPSDYAPINLWADKPTK